MNLSPHFTLEEFISSQTASRCCIDNTPDAMQVRNLGLVAATLEQVRAAVGGKPIVVSSGYRCPQLNHIIGGAPSSAHTFGLAADFTCPAYGTPREVAQRVIDAGIEFDQLIEEGTWVHIGLVRGLYGTPRRQVLTALFRPGQPTCYVPGLTPSAASRVTPGSTMKDLT